MCSKRLFLSSHLVEETTLYYVDTCIYVDSTYFPHKCDDNPVNYMFMH